MGVESKIRELLEGKQIAEEVIDEVAGNQQPTSSADAHRPLDKKQGDATPPLQGSSNPNPEQQDLSGTNNPEGGLTSEVGKAASAKAGSAPRPQNSGAGQAPNYTDGTDPRSVVNQSSSKGNVHQEEDEVEAETLFEDDIANLFEDEEHLSEEFKTKAASLFESVVVARVNQQISQIEDELVEEASKAFDEAKENLVENVDKYLSYVTEQWMKENELAIENGLRNEITESFIKGMKDVFVEHYIDVPDEKVDVLANQQQEIDELKSKLDEEIGKSVAISEEKEQLQKEKVFSSVVGDLAETEVEKFATLVNDVTFGDEEEYAQKLNVIKENYFPKAKAETSGCLLYTSPSPRDATLSRMPSSA